MAGKNRQRSPPTKDAPPMPNPRISVSQLKQLIQLRSNNLSTRDIARALSLSQGAVSKYCRAVLAACDRWEAALALEETVWERRVFAARRLRPVPTTTAPDCAWIHTEMKRHKHVTLQLLWEEYHGVHGDTALRYSAFCERYRQWTRRLQRSMRQRHFAGEKLFVDYAGRTVPIYGAACEEAFRASLFVGALGASGYAYAEATRTATLPDWLGSHVRMLEFYGASPTILVPDNPRVGVTKADRYEPELQRSYEEMAGHFGIAVIRHAGSEQYFCRWRRRGARPNSFWQHRHRRRRGFITGGSGPIGGQTIPPNVEKRSRSPWNRVHVLLESTLTMRWKP